VRILFASLTPFPRTGGQTTFLVQISHELRGMGHEVDVVSPSQLPESWMTLADRFSAVVRVVARSWLWFFVRLRLMAMFLRLHMITRRLWNRIDVIDAQDPPSVMALSRGARKRGIPLVLTLHGYYHFESNLGSIPAGSFWSRRLVRLERRACAKASKIVAVDTRLRDYVLRMGIAGEKVIVRANSVDCNTFQPADKDMRAAVRQRMGLRPDVKAICCARRFVEKCGVTFAIQAMKSLRDRGVDALLLIAGSGPLEEKLKSQVSDLNISEIVRFLGDVPRKGMTDLLHACDAAVVPSVTIGDEVEATSFSALEAMASGLPVVASNIGGLKDLIRDGVTGILVPERDPSALTEGIIAALGPKGAIMGGAARKEVLARFSLGTGAGDTLAIYERLSMIT